MNAPTKRRSPLLLMLFAACACLAPACTTPQEGDQPAVTVDMLIEVATAIGDAAVQLEGTRAVLERAPHLMPVLDRNKNGVIELAEIAMFDPRKPADLIALFLIVSEIRKGITVSGGIGAHRYIDGALSIQDPQGLTRHVTAITSTVGDLTVGPRPTPFRSADAVVVRVEGGTPSWASWLALGLFALFLTVSEIRKGR